VAIGLIQYIMCIKSIKYARIQVGILFISFNVLYNRSNSYSYLKYFYIHLQEYLSKAYLLHNNTILIIIVQV